MAARKKKTLVIVESPTKAKTINKYLGDDFVVMASYGHVRDLPRGRRSKGETVAGINIEAGWVPRYVVPDKAEGKGRRTAKEIVSELRKQADRAGFVYLATDPDREGEAIAWHLKEALGLEAERARRVTFNEITKRAIQEAFAHPGNIDIDRVAAQEARRFLDRVVGYKLSPLLGKKLTGGLSAGRVQSVAVRLVVEREREIEKFREEEFWKITAVVTPEGLLPKPAALQTRIIKSAKKNVNNEEDGEGETVTAPEVLAGSFPAELVEWAGQKFQAASEDDTARITGILEKAPFVVSRVEQKDQTERPEAPFITSTMQRQASTRLHFSVKKTMMFAQRLYEGVEMGSEGPTALITYMRTDSTRVSDDALKAVRAHIESEFGAPYLPATPNRFASGKSAQEAHEAIRPTDLSFTPERVEQLIPAGTQFRPDLIRLYTLIYRRFVASQMAAAVFAITNVEVQAAEGLLESRGRIMKFDGYRRVLSPIGKQEDILLPALHEKQKLDALDLMASQHFTQPPPRYSEASLVRALEKEGIGRPSTYAAIIEKIKDKSYVDLRERRFFATETGKLVTDLLVQHFPKIMDMKFTSHMEEELDQIEERKVKRDDVLTGFWDSFKQDLAAAEVKMETVKGAKTDEICPQCQKPLVVRYSKKTHRQFFGCSGWPECDYIKPEPGENGRPAAEVTNLVCPNCGKPMLRRMSRRGAFLGCKGYPECKTTMNFDAAGNAVPSVRATPHVCDKCGAPMVLREGPRGPFLSCSAFPKCRNAMDVDAEGNPIKPIPVDINCEKCGAQMVVKRGPKGLFLGCGAYPKCRSTKRMPEDMREKMKDLLPLPVRKTGPNVEVTETCPECGEAMKLRSGRGGNWFLGCSKYPKCRGTREVPPEMLDKIQAAGPALTTVPPAAAED